MVDKQLFLTCNLEHRMMLPTNLCTSIEVKLVHLEVVTTADKDGSVRVQGGRVNLCGYRHLSQHFKSGKQSSIILKIIGATKFTGHCNCVYTLFRVDKFL